MEKELLELLNTVLSNAGLDTISEMNKEQSLRDDLGLDSINLADLTVRIDDKFGIDVFEEDFIETVGQLLSILEKAGDNA